MVGWRVAGVRRGAGLGRGGTDLSDGSCPRARMIGLCLYHFIPHLERVQWERAIPEALLLLCYQIVFGSRLSRLDFFRFVVITLAGLVSSIIRVFGGFFPVKRVIT